MVEQQRDDDSPSFGHQLRGALPSLLRDVGVPLVAYYVMKLVHQSDLVGLLVGGGVAAVITLIELLVRRTLNVLSLGLVVIFALSAVVAVISGNARLLLVRESAVTGVLGVLCLVSCAFRRTVMFYLSRRLNTNTKEGLARFDELVLTSPTRIRLFRKCTAVLGVVLVGEAAVRLVLVYTLSIPVMQVVSGVMSGLLAVLLLAVFSWFGRQYRRRDATA